MIHPDTELRDAGDGLGKGVFATAPIPMGTVVYVVDRLEIVLPPETPLAVDPDYRSILDTYSYRGPAGQWIVCWDLAKYENHSCDPNTLCTGYGFEIAVRDIRKGEQITVDYGLLNVTAAMPCLCGSPDCRGAVRPDDFDRHHVRWDGLVRGALDRIPKVDQPLWRFMADRTRRRLQEYLHTGEGYRSVLDLRYDDSPEQQAKTHGLCSPVAASASTMPPK